jgi:hypothetical protein
MEGGLHDAFIDELRDAYGALFGAPKKRRAPTARRAPTKRTAKKR